MSVGFQMEYSVIIKGSKADFEQIPAVAQEVAESGKHGWNPEQDYPPMAEYFAASSKAAIESGDEPILMEMENSDGDATHGVFEDFLNGIDKKLPGLAIAVMASNIDVEYGSGSVESAYYSPAGSSIFDFDYTGNGPGSVRKFPDEDWIPYGWRHMDEKAPTAKAKGTLALLGDWSETEKDMVGKALMSDALEAMGYTAFVKGGEAVTLTDEGWEFYVGGEMNAGEAAQNLHLALLPYIEKHQPAYAILCKTMREKKLAIHLYLDESTGPNAAWSYCNNSAWHFLITSNGTQMVSKFTWCGTYAFSSNDGSFNYSNLYEQIVGKDWDYLSSEGKFMVTQAISQFSSTYERPSFPEVEKLIADFLNEGVDYNQWDADEWYDYVVDPEELQEQLAEYKKVEAAYREALAPVIAKTVAKAETLAPAPRLIPQTFDQRFAGKTFDVTRAEFHKKFGSCVKFNALIIRLLYALCPCGTAFPENEFP